MIPSQRRHAFGDPLGEPSPGPGTNRVRKIPNDVRGITFEIGRMIRYIRDFRADAMVVKIARRVVELCAAKDKKCEMAAIFLWVRNNFRYVNDPVNAEVIATPSQQLRELLTPPEVIERILGPDLVRQLKGFGLGYSLLAAAQPKVSGDCDEGAILLGTMLAAVGITPRLRFGGTMGGSECNYHHVWIQALNEETGEWVDMDVTETKAVLGWFHRGFDCYGFLPIFEG